MITLNNGLVLFIGVMFSVLLVNPVPFVIAVIAIIFIKKQEAIIDEAEQKLGESQRGCMWNVHMLIVALLLLPTAFILFSVVALGREETVRMMQEFVAITEGMKR